MGRESPSQESRLYDAFGHEQKSLRELAAREIVQDREKLGLKQLASWAEAPEWRVRQTVALSLGMIGQSEAEQGKALALLHQLLEDPHWRVVQQSIESLRSVGHTDSVAPLRSLQESGSKALTPSVLGSLHDALFLLDKDLANLRDLLMGLRHTSSCSDAHRRFLRGLLEQLYNEPQSVAAHPPVEGIHESWIEGFTSHVLEPLPDALQAESAPYLYPLMRRLRLGGWIGQSDISALLRLRFELESFSPVLVYEVLQFGKDEPYTRTESSRILAVQAEASAACLAEFLQTAEDEGQQLDIIYLLSALGAPAQCAFGTLVELLETRDNDLDGQIRAAIRSTFPKGGLKLDLNELLRVLRVLLSMKLHRGTWQILGVVLESCVQEADQVLLVDYIDQHLPEKARAQQAMVWPWLESLWTPNPSPFLRLLRKLELGTLSRKKGLPFSPKRMQTLLGCPQLQQITHLDLSHLKLTGALGAALASAHLPPGITHLMMLENHLVSEEMAALLEQMSLPALTHLYLSGQVFGQYSLTAFAQLPLLAQLKHISFKRCDLAGQQLNQLAESPFLTGVKRLILADNRIAQETAEEFLETCALDEGSSIDFRKNEQIADHPSLMALAQKRGLFVYL